MKRGWQVLLVGLALFATGGAQAEKSKFLVSINGSAPMHVKSVKGGHKKLSLEIDRNGADPVWSWVEASLIQTGQETNVVLPEGDKWVELGGSVVTSVSFPALDTSSSAELVLSVTFQAKKTAPASQLKGTFKKEVQKRWLPANFRLKLGDLPTGRVKKVDALTWSMKVQEMKTKKPSVSPLRITFDAKDASAWSAWLSDKKAKSGNLQLTEDDGSVWRTIQLDGVTPKSVQTTGDVSVATLAVKSLKLQ
jgi:hypothetical protein